MHTNVDECDDNSDYSDNIMFICWKDWTSKIPAKYGDDMEEEISDNLINVDINHEVHQNDFPVESNSVPSKGSILLLGMVFALPCDPNYGQTFRDWVRALALQNDNYLVRTLDDKHAAESLLGRHCQANFCDARRMKMSMDIAWSKNSHHFDHVILDYFFSPVYMIL
jgi:hypothetical protein